MGISMIGMLTSYSGIQQSDWLWQQTPHPFGRWGNIQMQATAAQPDFLLLYNCHDFDCSPAQFNKLKKIFNWQFHHSLSEAEIQKKLNYLPKERIISLWREPPFEEKRSQRIAGYALSEHYCGYVSGPDKFAPIPDYMPAIWYHVNSFREFAEMPAPAKTRSCSWITSGIDRTANHRQRLAFLQQLQQQFEFDLYGRGLPDWVKSKGVLANKWNGMAPYFYNLAIENYAENEWYATEKLWDALLAWCLPIYYGGSAADRLLPPGSFLRLPSFDQAGIDFIREVTATPDAWMAAHGAIAQAREIILYELNLLNWLSNYVGSL
ncbi:glycosyltransferase [Microcoleus sp. FACHB-1515]|uniref:glycosyltransferase family 10 domain-containing protein n=1 Tax=Cyanophyceae TaxID=3028117 RepID=UPI001684C937|nr:glycosyltransferase family 10 [Microcoleus sp. FACHB-1515]MBD2092791.1 glycosyltransferase [Microcoleus sp. FACHB-1515]